MATSDTESDRAGFSRPRRVPTFFTFNDAYEAIGAFARSQPEKQVGKKTNTYKYRDIDYHNDIRILRVLSGKKNDELRCMLRISALPRLDGSAPRSKSPIRPYWALSYWWGNDEPTHPVQMLEFEEENQSRVFKGYFYIRDNLAAALKHCRKEDKDVDIWVDALCINQEVTDEKGRKEKTAQVLRMHEVYSQAENVCIWLGSGRSRKESDAIKATFGFLETILDLKQTERFINTENNKKDHASNIEHWKRVVKLMQNPWFSRRWVIQELVLAKTATIRWGTEEMRWSDFADAVALIMTMHDHIAEMLNLRTLGGEEAQLHDPRALGANTLVNATTNLFRKSDDGIVNYRLVDLEVLVSSMFLPFEAKEPKDTIYAVLSLAKDTAAELRPKKRASWWKSPQRGFFTRIIYGIANLVFLCFLSLTARWVQLKRIEKEVPSLDPRVSPDYDKSLMEACADFMEYCVEKSGSLDILCRHWAPGPTESDKREDLGIGQEKRKKGTKLNPGKIEIEKLPSWISPITRHTYGGPKGARFGRSNGDSFVGGFERHDQQQYNTCGGLRAWFEFEKIKPVINMANRIVDSEEPPQSPTSPGTMGTAVPLEEAEKPSTPSLPRVNKFTGHLRVRGFEIGPIESLSERVAKGIIPKEALKYGGFYWTRSSEKQFPGKIPDRLWRTLVGDRGPEGSNAPAWYRRACLECLALVGADGELDTEAIKNAPETPKTMKTFLARVQGIVWNRKFFSTSGRRDKNLFGIVPGDTRMGDIICILFGCSVPVVLRRIDGQSGLFTLIGECYVHGKMEGEDIPPPNSRPEFPYEGVDEFIII